MQMGFNNDVSYKDLTLHIQTEDHGLGSNKITSQVFLGGAIIDSKTISYETEIEAYPGVAARDERIRTIMKALHRKFYQRIHEGIYDAKLPLGAEQAKMAPSAAGAGAATSEAALEVPEEMIAAEGFAVAGEHAELGEEYEANSRGEVLGISDLGVNDLGASGVDELEPGTLEHAAGRAAAAAGATAGFVQLGGLGTGSQLVVPEASAPAAKPGDSDSPIVFSQQAAFRGLEARDDLGEALLAALRG